MNTKEQMQQIGQAAKQASRHLARLSSRKKNSILEAMAEALEVHRVAIQEANAKDLADATSYHRERQGKRNFKGGSPLATSKGSTIVAREGLLNQLQDKFGKDLDKSILNEDIILDEEE